MSPDKFTLVQVINACASVRGLLQISTKDGYLLEIIWKFNWLIPTTRLSVIRLPTFTSTSQNLRVCVCLSRISTALMRNLFMSYDTKNRLVFL
jgi:hypothetical protein